MRYQTLNFGLLAAIATSAVAIPVVPDSSSLPDTFDSLSALEATINATYNLPTVPGFAREEIAAIFANDILEQADAARSLNAGPLFNGTVGAANATLAKREQFQNDPSGMLMYTCTEANCRGRCSPQPNLHYDYQVPAVIGSIWMNRGLGWDEQMDFSEFGGWGFNPVSCGHYLSSLPRGASRGCHNIRAQCLRLWHY